MSGNYKIGRVVGCFLIFLVSDVSADPRDLATVAREVFKGGNPYTESEIASVRSRSDIPEYQRTVLEVQMLGSVEDESRYKRAVEISTKYIDSGSIPWVRSFLRMQRGFTFNLLGEREKGASDLKNLIDNQKSSDIAAADDVLLSVMKERNPDLELYFDSVMRQSLGFYFLDNHKDAPLSEEAYQYFSGIKADLLKEKCLEQLKQRIGEKPYLNLLATIVENMDDIPRSQGTDIGKSRVVERESKEPKIEEPTEDAEESLTDSARISDRPDQPATSFLRWIIGGFALLVIFFLLFKAWKGKAAR